MENSIPRIVAGNNSEAIAMTMMIYALPNMSKRTSALAVMTGLGETWRISEAIKVWEQMCHTPSSHLIIAGGNNSEKTSIELTLEKLKNSPFNLVIFEGVHILQPLKHTADQAEKIVAKVQELGVSSLALFVSPFFILRAYCTLIKAFDRLGVAKIPVFPVPVSVPPSTLIPELGVPAWDMIEGEVERLKKYQKQGDVATYQELRDYIDWLWANYAIVERNRY